MNKSNYLFIIGFFLLLVFSFMFSVPKIIKNQIQINKNQVIIDKTNECIDYQLQGNGPACSCIKTTLNMMREAGYNGTDKDYNKILREREELYNNLRC